MSGFPLYDNLIKDIPKKDLSVKLKEKFVKNITKVNISGQELLYALIIVFHQQENQQELARNVIPYNGESAEQKKTGVYNFSWVFTQFPIKLRHLLFKFMEIHLKQQNTENQRKVSDI